MSIRHNIYIRDTFEGKTVYQNQIFGNNFYADEKFYEDIGVKLDEDALLHLTKINYKKLLITWHKYLNRLIDKKSYFNNIKNQLEEENEDLIISNLALYSWTYTGQLNLFFQDVKQYTKDFSLDILRYPYEIYLEIS